jgi:hypothetical protein
MKKILKWIGTNLKNAIVWGTQRAPVPVYDVTDEDLDEIQTARRKKKSGA